MKSQELRNLSAGELKEKVAEYDEELLNLRFQAKLGQLSNALQLREVRRERARALTILNEKKREEALSPQAS